MNITQEFRNICNEVIKKNFIFTIYSLPEENIIYLIFQKSDKISILNDFTEKSGFVVLPFNLNSDKYIIESDFIITNFDKINKNLINEISNKINKPPVNKIYEPISISKEQFKNKVVQIKNLIKENKIKKVVLSRVEKFIIKKDISLFDLFLNLKTTYPHAFNFLFSIKPHEYWIGSSPEPFLIINENETLTFSIAGTQISNTNIKWTKKDYQEQQIVSEYIEEILTKDLKFRISKSGPFTYYAGNVAHLKTTFHFNEININNKIINEIITRLHPTPSISGYPKEKAIEIINQIEEYDRDLYTGLIGPLNINNKCNLFVNLRCLKKYNNNLWFFQGAGIINDSIPEIEWDETENKKMTLFSIVSKIMNNEQQ